MRIFPTDEEIEAAANLLVGKYHVSSTLLGEIFGKKQRDQANSVLPSLGGGRMDSLQLAKLLVQREGPDLFAGNSKSKLRLHLLKKIPERRIKDLFFRHAPQNSKISSPGHMLSPLSEKKWHRGKRWPMDFVTELDFPPIFAGVSSSSDKLPEYQDMAPLEVPPPLVEFQKELKEDMLSVLNKDGVKTRCVVTLPTGGGKTRVAVEAFIDWMQPRFAEGKYLLWIAQSEELCEQAIACIKQMWGSREFVKSLRVYRYFGNYNTSEDALQGGVIVASIQKLHSRVKSKDNLLRVIIKNTGAMIIDEAHRATSGMYNNLFGTAEQICGNDLFPVCGLTATPGRSGISRQEETTQLVERFEAYLIKPKLHKEYDEDPLRYFREHQYLARAFHILYRFGREYKLTEEELREMNTSDDIPNIFLKLLADDKNRNVRILKRLLELPKGKSILVYACTVEHAHFLSGILTHRGRNAKVISAETHPTLRRGLISDFKEGKVEFLCNYGVLTTGFDAPKVDYIVLCRPTTSDVLYEQIIGRGLRGPRFGGTPQCTIIDFADNIDRFGKSLAYVRFKDFWDRHEEIKEE